jgi:peptide/nickel transport system substrate-binding protein
MKRTFTLALVAVAAALTFTTVAADARTLRWARSQDATTLDPHAANTGPNHNLMHHIYEPLIVRDFQGRARPALATEWRVLPNDPNVWEFRLRRGVTFHNGAPFTADDVVFSLTRAQQPAADMKSLLVSVESVTAVDPHTVHIRTRGPNALLPANLTDLFIMNKAWAEANNATQTQNLRERTENFATRNANGTGAFMLVSREPDVRTVLRRFPNHWAGAELRHGIDEIVYRPIRENATRVAALLSGEVDFVQDLPVQDIQRLQSTQGVRVVSGPENRVIFFGMNQGLPQLRSSDVQGRNPFADRRVREALNLAINRDAIQRVVMRGQAIPVGMLATPFVNGWSQDLGAPPRFDQARARALLAEAGYPNGFTVTLHTTNDRYVNDEGISQAVVGMLGQIGVRVTLVAQSLSVHFPALQRGEYDFYLLGWGIPTFDSHYIFHDLYQTRTQTNGTWNGTGYSNPRMDAAFTALNSETNTEARNASIRALWEELLREVVYLPIHTQNIAYGVREGWTIPVDVSNQPKLYLLGLQQ